MLFVLVTYDIVDDRRRLKVADLLQDYGARVQYSVFEVWLEAPQLGALRRALVDQIDPTADSVRLYRLCRMCEQNVEVLGQGVSPSPPGLQIL
jgi:CRISPR-associated protein Cas2